MCTRVPGPTGKRESGAGPLSLRNAYRLQPLITPLTNVPNVHWTELGPSGEVKSSGSLSFVFFFNLPLDFRHILINFETFRFLISIKIPVLNTFLQ